MAGLEVGGIEIEADNTEEILGMIKKAITRALVKIGMKAEGYAKEYVPTDTGNLKNSITFQVRDSEKAVYIGTNCEYAPYVELGTGKYYSGGRPTAWSYQDAKGNWHRTTGQRPQPYLKPAAANHGDEYRSILENEMKNG